MENIHKKIGIIGGGQLGQMMILEAKKMGFYVTVLDPTFNCPAHTLVDEHIVADFNDKSAIRKLAKKSDVVTYEFEHINAEVLKELEAEGKPVYPTATSLEIIQNKFAQKTVLAQNGVPVADFIEINSVHDIEKAGNLFGYPMLLKTCTGGYDGKGNYVVKSAEDCNKGFITLGSGLLPLMAERFFPFIMEISVLACRAIDGDIKVYPVAENLHEDNILDETHVPAGISQEITEKAMSLAKKVMEVFNGVGMFCMEMFVDKEGNVAINEVAPRPHNSGHYTIEACVTSQFEQHIRAISGLPLGDASLIRPVVMKNLLGADGFSGKTLISGADGCLAIPGVTLHIYGKEETKPKRKMGHITATASSLSEATKNVRNAYEKITIKGENNTN